MGISISEQCLCFFAAVLLGYLLGIFYEFFRILRSALHHRAFIIAIEDFFYCISCTFLLLLLCYVYANGIVRWFAIAGSLLGFYFYFLTLGRLIPKLAKFCIQKLHRFFNRLCSIFLVPLLNYLRKGFEKYKYNKEMSSHNKIKAKIKGKTKI